jgi:branched-chain amino acid transport system permease protein
MVTVALMMVIDGLLMATVGGMAKRFPAVLPEAPIQMGPFIFASSLVWGTGIAVLVTLALWWFYRATAMGLSMSAVAEDHQVSRSLGIDVARSTMLAWVIAAILAVLAIIVYVSGRGISPATGQIGIRALPVAVFAGLESIPGALLAGVIIGIGGALANAYLDPLTQGGMSLVFPFLIMLIVLLIRPHGLFGWERIERV